MTGPLDAPGDDGGEISNLCEMVGPRVARRRAASTAAEALRVTISVQNCRSTCKCEATMALRIPISRVRTRTIRSTDKMITTTAILTESINANWIVSCAG